MKTIYLVTGAAGNLGGNIVHELVQKGKSVRALVLPGDTAARLLPEGIETVEGDVLNRDDLKRFFDLPEGHESIVIHTAAIVTTDGEYSRKARDVNVNGTKNILEYCLSHNVKKLIYTSSTGAIPEPPQGRPVLEVSDFDPEKVVGFYAKTKAEASQLVADAVREKKLNGSIVFPTAICGPGDYAFGYVTQLLADIANEKMPAGIVGGFNAADVRDIAHGVILCAEKAAAGANYILGNAFVSVKDLFHKTHLLTGAKEIKLMVPLWLARLALPFFALYYRIRRSKPLFTSYALYNLTRNNNFCSDKAQQELGYKTRPFSETIEDILLWLQEEEMIHSTRLKEKMTEQSCSAMTWYDFRVKEQARSKT